MGEKKKFMGWHGEENICCAVRFDFRAQIVRYCSLDVTVLRLCALKFRQDFIDICKIDTFQVRHYGFGMSKVLQDVSA